MRINFHALPGDSHSTSFDHNIGVQSMFTFDNSGFGIDIDAFINAEEIHENHAKSMRRTSEEDDHTCPHRQTLRHHMTMHLGLEMVQVLLGNRARLVRQAHLAQTEAQVLHAFN